VLMAGVVLTGAYTGRLWFGIFHGAEVKSTHYAAHHAGHLGGFDLPLIPLAIGAIGLGYLEAGTHALSTMLNGVVVASEVHLAPSALGLGAFALGALGFGLGVVLAKRPQKGLPVPGGETAGGLLGELAVLPQGVAAVHGGSVGRYLVVTVIGTALIAGLSLRPVEQSTLPVRLDKAGTTHPQARRSREPAAQGDAAAKPADGKADSRLKKLKPTLLPAAARDALRTRAKAKTATGAQP
ncbi:MAG TPA: hypothetical protein VGF99_04015, partial [Myxococcota bacterium]